MKSSLAVLTATLGFLSATARAADAPRTPMITHPPMSSAAAPSVADPFSDQPADYEHLLRQTRTAALKRTLAQDELEIAQFKQKQAALGGGGSDGVTAGAPQDSATARQIAALEAAVKKLQQAARHRPRPRKASTAPVPSSVPTLQGVFDGGSGRSAWLKLGKQMAQLQSGGHIGPWTVRAIDADSVLIAGPGGDRQLVAAGDGSGEVRVTSPVGKGSASESGFGGGIAPGSTPASHNAITKQTAQSVIEALQRPH